MSVEVLSKKTLAAIDWAALDAVYQETRTLDEAGKLDAAAFRELWAKGLKATAGNIALLQTVAMFRPSERADAGDWDEAKHPRAANGQFGEGGSGETAAKLTEQAFASGGFTYRPDKDAPKDGYLVSLHKDDGFNHVVDIKEIAKQTGTFSEIKAKVSAQIKEHLDKTLDHLGQNPDHFFGGYVEKDDHGSPVALHLDVNEHHADRDKAVASGVARNQISVWDVAKSEEIKTGGTGR